MAHFAQLDANNIVIEVIVVNNAVIQDLPFPQSEPLGVAFCQSLYGQDTVWKQTSYNSSFRKHYADIGDTYNVALDAFIAPQPAPECTLDPETCDWICPVTEASIDDDAVANANNAVKIITDPAEMP